MVKEQLTVIDFFCGAGGFSEGFRQQGFEIVMGVDKWQAAIDTHNINHSLNDDTNDILNYWGSNSADIKDIEKLPDTAFIIGSPSCVSFSMSNKAGKADKTTGIQLIEAYLRVIAVKKHKNKSRLKGWYMENVPKSQHYTKEEYTFSDLNLTGWAKKIGRCPSEVALEVKGEVFNAGDYGAPQNRKRFISGEWVKTGEFIPPVKMRNEHIKSSALRGKMPKPNSAQKRRKWVDPNYPGCTLLATEITDHFYDTGLYKIEWEKAHYLKTNHPFMGKMAFPENENRKCRTITATRVTMAREALIYKSEYYRKGDGEYRAPTIREVASLMGFPYVYQFTGSETTKWRQIGNSVCPQMSAALAKALRKKMGLSTISLKRVNFSGMKKNYSKVDNLNTFSEGTFDSPYKRPRNARFRRHPIKLGNMTVDLLNYHPKEKDKVAKKWFLIAFFGTGDGYGHKVLKYEDKKKIKALLEENKFQIDSLDKKIKENICTSHNLQIIYENDFNLTDMHNPINIVKRVEKLVISQKKYSAPLYVGDFLPKRTVPAAQLMAMYALLSLLSYC